MASRGRNAPCPGHFAPSGGRRGAGPAGGGQWLTVVGAGGSGGVRPARAAGGTRRRVAGEVSAGKQRVLLAALLLRANQVVSAAELAGFIWEGSPPGTARVTLQNYVKRLRQALGPAG